MSLLEYFKANNMTLQSSAFIAKERLQIIVAHQRHGQLALLDSLPKLKEEIILIIRKYANVNDNHILVKIEQNSDDVYILNIDITLPDT